MATKKQQKEEIPEEKTAPLGLTARDDVYAKISMPEFFHLMKTADALVNLMAHLKQVNIQEDNIRYYFEENLEEVKDEKGNPVYVKNELGEILKDKEGEQITQKKLKDNFWSSVKTN